MPKHSLGEGRYKRPTFNEMGENIARVCGNPNCDIYPLFNFAGENHGVYCFQHKEAEMVDVTNLKSVDENCSLPPAFNLEGQRPALFCSQVKAPDMANIRHIVCQEDNCGRKYPGFNYPNSERGLYCSEHALPGMVAVRKHKSKQCKYPDCVIYPSYNFPGTKTEHFCGVHKAPGMVEVKRRCCEIQECSVRPSFNYPGLRKRRFCQAHMLDGMVHVVHAYNKDMTLKEGVVSRTRTRKHRASVADSSDDDTESTDSYPVSSEPVSASSSSSIIPDVAVSFAPLLEASELIERGIVLPGEMSVGSSSGVGGPVLPPSDRKRPFHVISYDEMK